MTLFKIYVVTSSPSVPANVQKNLHENNLNMQIFLFFKQSFSKFLNFSFRPGTFGLGMIYMFTLTTDSHFFCFHSCSYMK